MCNLCAICLHSTPMSALPTVESLKTTGHKKSVPCEWCGENEVTQSPHGGRRRLYCSTTCRRAAAYKKRMKRREFARAVRENKSTPPSNLEAAKRIGALVEESSKLPTGERLDRFNLALLEMVEDGARNYSERLKLGEVNSADFRATAEVARLLPQIRSGLERAESARPPQTAVFIRGPGITIGEEGRHYQDLAELYETQGMNRPGDTLLTLQVARMGEEHPPGHRYILEPMLPLWVPHDYRYIVAYGGRGSGKSYAVAQRVIIHALEKKRRILCVRQFQASINASSKSVIEGEIHAMGLSNRFEITERRIVADNGSEFLFHGMEKSFESLKSMEGISVLWGEEANKLSKESVDTLLPTIRTEGSRCYFTLNPDMPDDAIYARFLGENRREALLINVNWDRNPFFPEDELGPDRDADYADDHDYGEHIWKGELRQRGLATVFKPNSWAIKELPSPPHPHAKVAFGLDLGMTEGLTAIVRVWGWRDQENKVCLYVEDENIRTGAVPREDFEGFVLRVGVRDGNRIRHDHQAQIGSFEGRKVGFRMIPANKGPKSVHEGIGWLRNCKLVVHPRCETVIKELRLYSYKVDKHTGIPDMLRFEPGNDHTIDALRYACNEFIYFGDR